MQRVKPPPVRNKINLADAGHMRIWTRRLGITADELRAAISKVGDSVTTVTKEIELQRSDRSPEPAAGASTERESQTPV